MWPQYIQTDTAITVYIWVIDSCSEGKLQNRHSNEILTEFLTMPEIKYQQVIEGLDSFDKKQHNNTTKETLSSKTTDKLVLCRSKCSKTIVSLLKACVN